MDSYRMRFIIGKLTDEELLAIKQGQPVVCKMLLIPDDYRVFHYQEGDDIEAETQDGNRIWTTIRNLEIIEDEERIILIFTLIKRPCEKNEKS